MLQIMRKINSILIVDWMQYYNDKTLLKGEAYYK